MGKKTTFSDETNHPVVSLLPTEEDSRRMSGGKGAKRTNSGSAVKKTTFSDERNHDAISLLPEKEDSSRWVSTLVPLTLLRRLPFMQLNSTKTECCTMLVMPQSDHGHTTNGEFLITEGRTKEDGKEG